MPIRL